MAVKKRGLGRGLDALLGGTNVNTLEEQALQADKSELQYLPLDLIQRGKYQPRRDMDPSALEELAQSIKAQGVMQPIVVRPIDGGRFEIIAGERRWRASQLAGLDKLPAMVREVPDEAAIAMALIENIQREDLNPIEEAVALQRLQQEFFLAHCRLIGFFRDLGRRHLLRGRSLLLFGRFFRSLRRRRFLCHMHAIIPISILKYSSKHLRLCHRPRPEQYPARDLLLLHRTEAARIMAMLPIIAHQEIFIRFERHLRHILQRKHS